MKKIALLAAIVTIFLTTHGPLNASSTSTETSTPGVYELENEPSECIGFLPKPGCGKQPEDAGERGGTMQFLVFAIMLAGLTVIGIGIARGVKKQRPTAGTTGLTHGDPKQRPPK